MPDQDATSQVTIRPGTLLDAERLVPLVETLGYPAGGRTIANRSRAILEADPTDHGVRFVKTLAERDSATEPRR